MFLGSIVGSDSYYICPPVILVVSNPSPVVSNTRWVGPTLRPVRAMCDLHLFLMATFTFQLSGQAVVTGVVPSPSPV